MHQYTYSILTRHCNARPQQGGADPVPPARVRGARQPVRLRSADSRVLGRGSRAQAQRKSYPLASPRTQWWKVWFKKLFNLNKYLAKPVQMCDVVNLKAWINTDFAGRYNSWTKSCRRWRSTHLSSRRLSTNAPLLCKKKRRRLIYCFIECCHRMLNNLYILVYSNCLGDVWCEHIISCRTIADALKSGRTVQPEAFDSASVLFTDIVHFTVIASHSNPVQIVSFLNQIYSDFDNIIASADAYKVNFTYNNTRTS